MKTATRARAAWCLFDFANSAFPTVALTAFGAPYFAATLVGPQGLQLGAWHLGAPTLWGMTLALSMALVALTALGLGVLADQGGQRRRLLTAAVLLAVLPTAALGWLSPGQALAAAALYLLANFAFEAAYVVYNAYLPDLARPAEYGRLSGRAWALGYAGGLLALAICYPLLPRQGQADRGAALGIYAIIAGWYLLFSLPALAWLPQAAPAADTASLRTAMRRDLRALGALWRTSPALRVFTVAYFLYNDAVVTVIQFTGMFTQEVLHFSARDNLWLFLLLNIVAVPGTLLFGRLFDRLSGVRILQLLMLLWTVVVLGASQVHSRAAFWPVAALAALILGATQAASRAQMARLAPPDASGRAMALLALSGKASAVLGPLLYGLIADAVAQSTGAATGHRVAIGAFALVFGAAAWILQSTARHSATPSQKA